VGTDPATSFVGNFDGNTDLVTVDAGSNDLTLISGFAGGNPVTTTLSSGGLDPATAFEFAGENGFEDLVVGNTGDGVLALFEGGASGLNLMSAETEPSLPSPTALAFASLTGGQVEFYAATAGCDAATLVALNLTGETLAQALSASALASVNNVAQLVPLSESSVALVTTFLTLTISTSTTELEGRSADTDATFAFAASPGASISLGQGLSHPGGRDVEATAEGEQPGQAAATASPASPGASAWERFILGLDEALEQFRREFKVRILEPKAPTVDREQPAAKPSADSSRPGGPQSALPSAAPATSLLEHEPAGTENATRAVVDVIIDSMWREDQARRDEPSLAVLGAAAVAACAVALRSAKGRLLRPVWHHRGVASVEVPAPTRFKSNQFR
jgi:hypothetical protein